LGQRQSDGADRGLVDSAELSLVPPARLAVLLVAKRRELGSDVAQLSMRSATGLSPNDLDRIERGQAQLSESRLRDVIDLYGLNTEASLPNRSKLILDLDAGHVGVGDTAVRFESSTADVVLERYVSLLYLLRDEQPGRRLSLRDDDLDVLGSTLDLPVTKLTTDLVTIMGASAGHRTSRFSRHLTVGAAGLLVGVTVVGSLIIVGAPPGDMGSADPVSDDHPVAAAVLASHDGIQRTEQAASASAITVPISSPVVGSGEVTLAVVRTEAKPTAVKASKLTTASGQADEVPTVEAPIEAAPIEVAATASVEATTTIDLAAIEDHAGRNLSALVPGWTIEITGDRAGYRGLTSRSARTIWVHVNDGDTVGDATEILAHEMGHAIDLDRLDDTARLQWVEMRGMPHVWWAGEGLNDFAVGAGDFAEGVAAYLVGSPSHSVYGGFSADQLAFVGQFVG